MVGLNLIEHICTENNMISYVVLKYITASIFLLFYDFAESKETVALEASATSVSQTTHSSILTKKDHGIQSTISTTGIRNEHKSKSFPKSTVEASAPENELFSRINSLFIDESSTYSL